MDLPSEVVEAIEKAVSDEGQGPAVAYKLASWLDALASGGESLSDSEAVKRRLDVIVEAVAVGDDAKVEAD